MRPLLSATMLLAVLAPACQPESSTSPDDVSASVELAEAPADQETDDQAPVKSPAPLPPAGEVAELSVAGIGPVKLGMTYAELVWAGLNPESIDGGVAVGPYRVGFAPAKGGPSISVHVRLGDLPDGLKVGGKILKNESTSLQQLADAVGSCEPIEPNIGQASTTCHGGRIKLSGAGPIGGVLTITVKSSS